MEEVRKIIRNRERLASEGRSETTGRGVAGVAGGPGVARIFDPKTGSGGWNKFEEKWWWKKPDGTAARAEWLYTGGKWYYLGDDYMMRTGWIQDQGK